MKGHAFTIHVKKIECHAAQVCRVKMGLSPVIMTVYFQYTENPVYKLRSGSHMSTANNIRTVSFGSEPIANLGAKVFNLIPEEI